MYHGVRSFKGECGPRHLEFSLIGQRQRRSVAGSGDLEKTPMHVFGFIRSLGSPLVAMKNGPRLKMYFLSNMLFFPDLPDRGIPGLFEQGGGGGVV